MASLSILMPTHCRQNTAFQTLTHLHTLYLNAGFATQIICIDSSHDYSKLISDLDFVDYIHVPGYSFHQKFQVAGQLIKKSLVRADYILWSPDDDLFLPNNDLFRFCCERKSLSSNYYIPYRYIFFSPDSFAPDALRVVESWTHHVHIAKLGLSVSDQINSFVDQGVNSCWGIFSKTLFKYICDLTSSCLTVFTNKAHHILIEDCWNILILTADWVSLAQHPTCLRGLDRRYHNISTHIPSWIAFKQISQENRDVLLARTLFNYLCMNSLEFSQLTSENGTKLARTLIKRHCIGYQAASSRAYISSLPLIFSPSRLSKLLSPQILIKDKASDYSVVLMPNSLDNVNCQLYPTTHILSDSLLLHNIYKYLPFFRTQRDS